MLKRASILLFSLACGLIALGQCGSYISTFPYTEDFEAGAAWASGGIGNDWEWGTPAHPVINSAGGGSKSWCVGGLSGQFYELDAQSWLRSPCFDFSGLLSLEISFKIFWETERTYDGMVLQYSLDGGTSWSNVGAYGDPEDCWNANWYNTSNITNLDEATPKHGWSGRQGATSGSCQGGQGSGGWVTASHCISDLAGEPSVRFRFLFGSGSTCNNYDGIAIDDIRIGQPISPFVSADLECEGLSMTYTATLSCQANMTWDFGDPASGSANTAAGTVVSHTFSAPGTYMVSYMILNSCGSGQGGGGPITVLGLDLSSTASTCGLANGTASVEVVGSPGPFNYDWEPGNGASALVTDLLPGDYDITVSGTAMCPVSGTVTVVGDPSTIVLSVDHTDVSCYGAADGTATVTVSGGTAGSILWSPSGSDQAQATGLSGGDQLVTVVGIDGCEANATVTIIEPDQLVTVFPADPVICDGESVTLAPQTTGGTGSYSYAWAPEGPEVAPATTTIYTVSTTDANGCVAADVTTIVNVGEALVPTILAPTDAHCAPACIPLTAGPVGMAAYAFDYGDGTTGTEPLHCYAEGGVYTVSLTITDGLGCQHFVSVPDLVAVNATPVAGFALPPVITEDRLPLLVQDLSEGATVWQWSFGGGTGVVTDPSPVIRFAEPGCYTVQQQVSNDLGCTDSTQAIVCVEGEFAVYAPNAFTPDGDGHNEGFRPITSVRYPQFYQFTVFDRWGEVVFSSAASEEYWSGANLPIGIYAWRMSIRDSVGKLHKTQGHVTLIR